MKKTLIVLACASAINPVFANDSVVLYGVIDEGYHKHTREFSGQKEGEPAVNTTGSQTGIVHGLSQQNHFGIRVTESLGQGTSVKAVAEFGYGEPNNGNALRQAWVGIGHQDSGMVRLGHIKTSTHQYLHESDPSGSRHTAGSLSYNRDKAVDYASGIQYIVNEANYGFTVGVLYADNNINQAHERSYIKSTSSGYELAGRANYGSFFGKVAYLHGKTQQSYENGLTLDQGSGTARRDSLVTTVGYKVDPMTSVHYTYYHQSELGKQHFNEEGEIARNPQRQRADGHQIGFNTHLTHQAEAFGAITIGKGWEHEIDHTYQGTLVAEPKLLGYQMGLRYHLSPRTDVYSIYGTQTVKGRADQPKDTEQTFSVGLKHSF